MADASDWAERVAAWRASGMTAKTYCAGREFSAGTLHFWSSKLRSRALAARGGDVKMARVIRVSAAEHVTSCPLIVEVGGARVHVPNDVDADLLARVVAVLRRANAP